MKSIRIIMEGVSNFEFVSLLDEVKAQILHHKTSYDMLLREYRAMKLENARMKENEKEMMRASTLVTALNDNHQLREEVRLLKGSLKKALADLRFRRSSHEPGTEAHEQELEPDTQEQEPGTEEQEPDTQEQEPDTQEPDTQEEEPDTEEQEPGTEEEDSKMSTMTFKKTLYFADEEGHMYQIKEDSTVGPIVGSFRIVNGKYKVRLKKS